MTDTVMESFEQLRELGESALTGEIAGTPDLDAAINAARAGDFGRAREIVAAAVFSERDAARVERAIQIKTEQDEERREIGRRFSKARELNGMSQCHAAELLGYRNSAPLSKIEAGIAPPPPWLYKRASTVYGVSCDYLHCASAYPERDPRTVEQIAIMTAMRESMQKFAQRLSERAILAAAEIVPLKSHLIEITNEIHQACEALASVREKNPSFDNRTRGGARLLNRMEALHRAAESANRYINRQRAIHQEAADLAAAANGDLFDTIFEDGDGE